MEAVLRAWGANSYGQLGLGHKEDVLVPQLLKDVSCKCQDIKSIAGGGGHSAVITGAGELFVCGHNKAGQLGLNHTEDVLCFTLCTALSGFCVQEVACGWDFTIILGRAGLVLSCGSNAFGQLGVPQISGPCLIPQKIKSLKEKAVGIAAGLRHALAATESGLVFQWGTGMASRAKRVHQGKTLPVFWAAKEPCEIKGLEDVKVKRVAAGSYHCVSLTETGKVFTWGRADYGQLGRHAVVPDGQETCTASEQPMKLFCNIPISLPCLNGASQIACGSEHNLAVVGDCCLSWGWNEHGMCGDGTEANVHVPKPVKALGYAKQILIGCGAGHSLALCQNSTLDSGHQKS
ncbi:secretion-regulating guanine nucleotide exchange factor isoform X7 [Gallus gallus]|uniref:secretion-regulating guanine nucleotide exchange factor isoform X7 n=1 Tax=Gallus gallus TaxID=9031 RepID=UPI001F01CBAA|nr:secretion-regulating guanine nucleotide exchange factor isoform X7 [Gallus gallus]XP_046797995.1 secretion-regulating guanine nucleotide exchange factor isoform X7 [Gallus gallus]